MNYQPPSGRARGAMPFQKYNAFRPIDLPDRQWPSKVLDKAPRWCSVDLRDGNQALIDPMNVEEKLRLWDLLLDIGFAEIEVGFPAASQPEGPRRRAGGWWCRDRRPAAGPHPSRGWCVAPARSLRAAPGGPCRLLRGACNRLIRRRGSRKRPCRVPVERSSEDPRSGRHGRWADRSAPTSTGSAHRRHQDG